MICESCDNGYIASHNCVLCHTDGLIHCRTEDNHPCFIPRKVDIVPILDRIAEMFSERSSVIFADSVGTPLFTLERTQNILEIEMILRTFVKKGEEYILL